MSVLESFATLESMTLKPPVTQYASYDEIGKFNMMWNVCLVLVPIFLILLGIHLLFGDINWYTSLAALLLAGGNLVILYKTRKYKVTAMWSVGIAVLICQASIILVNDSHIVTDTMWCVMTSFFTYFMFGWIAGTFVLLLNLTGLLIFLFTATGTVIESKGINANAVDGRLVVNVYYVAVALGFIIYKIVENNKLINKRYSEQIDRNEILLKEIHHRVKNNLQIISSLLRLQSFESDDPLVREQFGEAIGRIRSMALIHEKMYHDDDMSQIDLPSYLVSLANDIMYSSDTTSNVEFNVEAEIKQVDIKNIVPISLIFNELITNSIKHGLGDMKHGKIDLSIESNGGQMIFHYIDNGSWKEPETDMSFGLELIETLTGQMEGTCERWVEHGTHYRLIFDGDHFFFKD